MTFICSILCSSACSSSGASGPTQYGTESTNQTPSVGALCSAFQFWFCGKVYSMHAYSLVTFYGCLVGIRHMISPGKRALSNNFGATLNWQSPYLCSSPFADPLALVFYLDDVQEISRGFEFVYMLWCRRYNNFIYFFVFYGDLAGFYSSLQRWILTGWTCRAIAGNSGPTVCSKCCSILVSFPIEVCKKYGEWLVWNGIKNGGRRYC